MTFNHDHLFLGSVRIPHLTHPWNQLLVETLCPPVTHPFVNSPIQLEHWLIVDQGHKKDCTDMTAEEMKPLLPEHVKFRWQVAMPWTHLLSFGEMDQCSSDDTTWEKHVRCSEADHWMSPIWFAALHLISHLALIDGPYNLCTICALTHSSRLVLSVICLVVFLVTTKVCDVTTLIMWEVHNRQTVTSTTSIGPAEAKPKPFSNTADDGIQSRDALRE